MPTCLKSVKALRLKRIWPLTVSYNNFLGPECGAQGVCGDKFWKSDFDVAQHLISAEEMQEKKISAKILFYSILHIAFGRFLMNSW